MKVIFLDFRSFGCYFPPTSNATWNQFRTDVIPMTNTVIPLLRRNNNKTPTITTIIITYLAQLSDLCFTCSISLSTALAKRAR